MIFDDDVVNGDVFLVPVCMAVHVRTASTRTPVCVRLATPAPTVSTASTHATPNPASTVPPAVIGMARTSVTVLLDLQDPDAR